MKDYEMKEMKQNYQQSITDLDYYKKEYISLKQEKENWAYYMEEHLEKSQNLEAENKLLKLKLKEKEDEFT
jgi:hypothetical protein